MKKTEDQYTKVFNDYIQKDLLDLCGNLMININKANSIYPTMICELEQRQLLQDEAIGICESLYQELEYLVDIFPKTIKEVSLYTSEIIYEISLLRKWKQSNNKLKKGIKRSQSE